MAYGSRGPGACHGVGGSVAASMVAGTGSWEVTPGNTEQEAAVEENSILNAKVHPQ